MKEEIKEIRAAFERIGKLLDQMEGVPTATEVDPLEGKQVEGFSGFKNIGLNCGEHHLWYGDTYNTWNVMHKEPEHPTPYHLTRVTERTVGRFYLIEGRRGNIPQDFALYLGDKCVGWEYVDETEPACHPIYVSKDMSDLSMYEVT